MAANIEIRTIGGKEIASFVENAKQERAWHKLGEVYDRPLTAIEALQGAHADFEVGLQPIVSLTPEIVSLIERGESIDSQMLAKQIIEGQRATMRLDYNETLGIVSESYGVVQNKHAFDFIDLLTTGELGGDTPTIECAGLLGKGERVFITAKFPEPIRLAGKDDIIDMYVVFTTSHDGTGAVTCMVTPVRVVCNNTLNLALKNNSGKISMRHTSHVLDRLDLTNKENAKMAYQSLNLYNTYKEYFEDSLARLAKVSLSDKATEGILAKALLSDEVFKIYRKNNLNLNSDDIPTRSKNIMMNVTEALHTGIGQDRLQAGTGLWLVNGLTTYYQNNLAWKDEEKKFKAITEGSVQQKLQSVYDAITYQQAA